MTVPSEAQTSGAIEYTLLDEAKDLPEGATLVTPLTDERIRITDTQEHRVGPRS